MGLCIDFSLATGWVSHTMCDGSPTVLLEEQWVGVSSVLHPPTLFLSTFNRLVRAGGHPTIVASQLIRRPNGLPPWEFDLSHGGFRSPAS